MRPRAAFFVLLALFFEAPAGAQVKPGETIHAKDAARVKDLVSPGVHWLVSRGMNMKIVEHQPMDDPPAYREATEKYSGRVRLAPEGVLDESTYVAGRPFSAVDANDPQAAVKIMYNFERTQYFTDISPRASSTPKRD